MSDYIYPYSAGENGARASGRTVMHALHIVQVSLDNPHRWVEISDHAPHVQADRMLFGLVVDVLRALRVQFNANQQNFTVMTVGPPQPFVYPSIEEIQRVDNTQRVFFERMQRRNNRNI